MFNNFFNQRQSSKYKHWLASPDSEDRKSLKEQIENHKLNIKDLRLDEERMDTVLYLRELALTRGKDNFEVKLDNKKYLVNAKTLDLIPLI